MVTTLRNMVKYRQNFNLPEPERNWKITGNNFNLIMCSTEAWRSYIRGAQYSWCSTNTKAALCKACSQGKLKMFLKRLK